MRVHELLDFHAKKSPDREFAVWQDERITYGEAQHRANRFAQALADDRTRLGDRVAILQKNSIETILLFLGASKAGTVATPLNYRLLSTDWLKICSDTQPKWFFCDAEFVSAVEEIKSQLTSVEFFISTCEPPVPGWMALHDWECSGSRPLSRPLSFTSFGPDQDALLLHTSGTTGPPKVAALTHRAVSAAANQLKSAAMMHPHDRFLLVLPLCHAAGIMSMLHTVSCGAGLVIQRDFEPAGLVDTLETENVTVAMMVPTMIRRCLDEVPDVQDRGFSQLRLLIYGASPIQENTVREMMDVFGCELAQRYGTTETLSLTWLSPADHRLALERRPGLLRSAGHPLPGTAIQIVDGNGDVLESGQRGEIVVRGPQLMRGYWKSVEDDRLPDDWVSTGDVGFIDSDGYLYICDRMKDVIISGGENIIPRDIESVLSKHPEVEEVAVIGVPDPRWGERVKAVVVRAHGTDCSAEELIEYCRGQLAGFKVPGSVDFVPRLPRNPAGKLQKGELRKPYWHGHDRSI